MQNGKIQQLIDEHKYLSHSLGMSKKEIKDSFLHYLLFGLGRIPKVAKPNDLYIALAMAVRDRVFNKYIRTVNKISKLDARAVAYLSAEYLPGPHLENNLFNLKMLKNTREGMNELDVNLDDMLDQEEEPGLGNGGLGRLASCYMDAMANLGVPSIAYGIRYEFGIFDQFIKEGWQGEETDKWLRHGNPWEVGRSEIAYEVKYGGNTYPYLDTEGNYRVDWQADYVVKGIAYDTPIIGYSGSCSLLRLWKAEAVESFDFTAYNQGDYYKAVEAKMISENITKVLYPNDQALSGRELRLKQQIFFVSCALQDLIRLHLLQGRDIRKIHEKFVIQLNDTHPAIAVAELMRLLLDEHLLNWDDAWETTTQTFAYTNHTLLPEALEKWPVSIFESLLPRHLEIIYEINQRFLDELRTRHGFADNQLRMSSLIDETGERYVRMAHLAVVGSHTVNGVSELHSNLLKTKVLNLFNQIWPNKFTNVTNGITQRRFLGVCNPALSELISSAIGDKWLHDLEYLRELESMVGDSAFLEAWGKVKYQNKERLTDFLNKKHQMSLDPSSLFDMQAKRIHEYKRQHLKIIHILYLYLEIKAGRLSDMPAQTFFFAGKAAPSYHMAKLIIRLIHGVAELIEQDAEVRHRLKVVFIPDFNVKNAERLYPSANLSEQISLAGKEASGTGNMKFALNGALTIGTLDGANVEIREAVGEENFFLFGLSIEEVENMRSSYSPKNLYEENDIIRRLLDLLVSGELSRGDQHLFRPLYDDLMGKDAYFLLADFFSYHESYMHVLHTWRNKQKWNHMSVLNVAQMGKFAADRSIQDYCKKIWHISQFIQV
ncbi:glycogen/starch/alpha-glucan phosphorylase [Catalinimonas sp. 4WD22]|uniref:glycogen/starch/alpha-glucan phosphorylase n=1 Tax=Catalinimonas locisalis TaxID=3133978 RepID=UPI003101A417